MGGEFGTEQVRANIEPERGYPHSGRVVATGDNQWNRFTTTPLLIEGVAILADEDNAGKVRLGGPGDDGPSCYPLSAGDTFSMAIDDLSKVYLYFEGSGDIAYFEVITHTGD